MPSVARICVARKAQTGKLPSRIGREEVAVRRTNVLPRSRAGSAAQHVLPRHEFAVVFADGAGCGLKTRVRRIVAARPFPHVAESLRERARARDRALSERMQRTAFHKVSGA